MSKARKNRQSISIETLCHSSSNDNTKYSGTDKNYTIGDFSDNRSCDRRYYRSSKGKSSEDDSSEDDGSEAEDSDSEAEDDSSEAEDGDSEAEDDGSEAEDDGSEAEHDDSKAGHDGSIFEDGQRNGKKRLPGRSTEEETQCQALNFPFELFNNCIEHFRKRKPCWLKMIGVVDLNKCDKDRKKFWVKWLQTHEYVISWLDHHISDNFHVTEARGYLEKLWPFLSRIPDNLNLQVRSYHGILNRGQGAGMLADKFLNDLSKEIASYRLPCPVLSYVQVSRRFEKHSIELPPIIDDAIKEELVKRLLLSTPLLLWPKLLFEDPSMEKINNIPANIDHITLEVTGPDDNLKLKDQDLLRLYLLEERVGYDAFEVWNNDPNMRACLPYNGPVEGIWGSQAPTILSDFNEEGRE